MNTEQVFEKKDLYGILELEKTAQIHDSKLCNEYTNIKTSFLIICVYILVKKNYYRLVHVYHPDRVTDVDKSAANERFSLLHNAYFILSNPDTKKIYDCTGSDGLLSRKTVIGRWEYYMKTVTAADIQSARERYQNSNIENCDVKREFVSGNGSLTHLMNTIPFMRVEDESRIIELLKSLIAAGEIPSSIAIKKIQKKK